MMDEFFGDYDSFKEETKEEVKQFILDKKTVWIAMSNNYGNAQMIPSDVDLKLYLRNQFPPGFKVAEMKMPLRSPLKMHHNSKIFSSKSNRSLIYSFSLFSLVVLLAVLMFFV